MSAYLCRDPDRHGLTWPDLRDFFRDADVLLNLGGVCWTPDFLLCRRRALIDMDPFFTQIGKMGLEGFDKYTEGLHLRSEHRTAWLLHTYERHPLASHSPASRCRALEEDERDRRLNC